YLLPSVVHDYLYRMQIWTRDQADHILKLMSENKVPGPQRLAIYGAVRAAPQWSAQNRPLSCCPLRSIGEIKLAAT
ncbi:MAG TPA: DUF1353 domain-containing protein, partial [Candidatus Binatia bacterium]